MPEGTPSNRGAIHPSQVGLTARFMSPVNAPPVGDPRSNAMQPLDRAAQPPRYQGTLYENQRGGSPKNQASQNAPPPPPLIHMNPPCAPRAGCEGQNHSRFSSMIVPAPAHAMQAGSYTPQKGVAKQPVSEWGAAAKLANMPAQQVFAPVNNGQKSQISIRPAGQAREVTRCDLCAAQMTGSACVKTSCGHQYHQRCLESYVKQLMDRNVHKLRCPACMVPLNVILSSENPVPLFHKHHQTVSKWDLGHQEIPRLLSPNSVQYSAPQANLSILPMDYKTVSPKQVSAFYFQSPYSSVSPHDQRPKLVKSPCPDFWFANLCKKMYANAVPAAQESGQTVYPLPDAEKDPKRESLPPLAALLSPKVGACVPIAATCAHGLVYLHLSACLSLSALM